MFSDVSTSDLGFQSGDRDEDGIFIAVGPGLRKAIDLDNEHIQDLTVCHGITGYGPDGGPGIG